MVLFNQNTQLRAKLQNKMYVNYCVHKEDLNL